MKRKVEILAPAGSVESLKGALLSGADAVYVGGSRFGARAYAKNLTAQELLEGIDLAHFHGKKLYLTVNTLCKEEELSGELYSYIEPFYRQGLDGVIVQDFGVFSFLKREFPGLPLHGSTQMTVTGPLGASLLEQEGASRVVLARELSLKEIGEIRKKTSLELEVFVHGAICYCYSGQCLFSSMLGGRSGNRGRCAQPCRLPYEVYFDEKKRCGSPSYVMNLKDMCALEFLPELLEGGVDSLKIEGRMKSPLYTAGVTALYRKYVDRYLENGRQGFSVEKEDLEAVSKLYDRGGYTGRYFFQHNGKDMIASGKKPDFRKEDEGFRKGLEEVLSQKEKSFVRKAYGRLVLEEGKKAYFQLADLESGVTVIEEGPVCQPAKSRPLTEEEVFKRISKTGETGFHFEKLEVIIKGNLFLTVGALNGLRREGLSALKREYLAPWRRNLEARKSFVQETKTASEGQYAPSLAVSLEEPTFLKEVLAVPEVSLIELESASLEPEQWKSLVSLCHKNGKAVFLSLPRVFRQKEKSFFEDYKELMKKAEFDGFLARNLEGLWWLSKERLSHMTAADDGLYTWNKESREFLKPYAFRDTVPLELNEKELAKRGCQGSEMLVYGKVPLMITANCLKKTTSVCNGKTEWLRLVDRKKVCFPVKTNCRFCYNTIYNSVPLYLLDQAETIRALCPSVIRVHFTTEKKEQIREILLGAVDFMKGQSRAPEGSSYTRGHFRRGVE